MAVRKLSAAELDALTSWPAEVAHSDLVEYFTLDVDDLRWVRSHRGSGPQLGLAVALCGLRFVPADLAEAINRLAERVGGAPGELARYNTEVDGRSRRAHVLAKALPPTAMPCPPPRYRPAIYAAGPQS